MHIYSRPRKTSLLRLVITSLCAIGLVLVAALPDAAAQDSDPVETIEALALRVHVQNIRAHNFTYWSGGNLGQWEDAMASSGLGKRLEGWSLDGFAGDEGLVPDDIQRPTILNFWASWCPPCRAEFPHLVDVALHPEDYPFDIVFVNMSDTASDALAFLEQYPSEIHTVRDTNNGLSMSVDIVGIPTSLLLDPDGLVTAVHVGTLTPTVTEFLSEITLHPDVGTFNAAEHEDSLNLQASILPVTVEDAVPLLPDAPAQGTITRDDFQDAYRFEARSGDEITLSMDAPHQSVDTYLVLLSADGERLIENDDASEYGTNAGLTYVIPEDGTYLVVATRFLEAEGFDEGEYELLLTSVSSATAIESPQPPEPTGETEPVVYGQDVTGELGGEKMAAAYSFSGSAQDLVAVRVTYEPAFTPLDLELTDTEGTRLAADERAVGGSVELQFVSLPADGEYTVTVRRTDATAHLQLTYSLVVVSTQPATLDDEFKLTYGGVVSGTLNDDTFEQRWTFEGAAGDSITLDMQRVVDAMGGLDGYLILLGPDGGTLVEMDDSSTVMPRISQFTLPTDGVYIVVATRFGFANGFSTGDYTLALSLNSTAAAPTVTTGPGLQWIDPNQLSAGLRWLAYNDQVSGTITDSDFEDWYIVRGRTGDEITVRMQRVSGELDPYLIITDAEGFELARNDDEGISLTDAAITFVLPETSTYLVRATRYGFGNGLSSGEYVLQLETDAVALEYAVGGVSGRLEPGAMTTGTLNFDTVGEQYTLTGRTGERITISAQRTSGDLDPALSLRGPDGEEIALNRQWLSPAEARIRRFVLPADGDYTLTVILEDLTTSGDYRLLLLTVPESPPPPFAFLPSDGLDVEVVLIWDGAADLDLTVTGPDTAPPGEQSHTGRDFCADEPAAMQGLPTERVIWVGETATSGLYTASVQFQFDCAGTDAPVSFVLALAVDGAVVDVIGGALVHEGDRYITLLDRAH